MGNYTLECAACKASYSGLTDSFRLRCDNEPSHGPSLLRTKYDERQLKVRDDLPGIFKFLDWLPCANISLPLHGKSLPYKSDGLAKHLGLTDLWIAYSGYRRESDPENLVTRTFKEFEAQATYARYFSNKLSNGDDITPFIISSAGNTANAFIHASHALQVPIYVVIPQSGLSRLRLPEETSAFSIVVKGDYSDAILLADKIADKTGLMREGGVKNIARRDGMGTVMLEAVVKRGSLFNHYFQAVGSGSGAIAAYEAAQRLAKSNQFGDTNTKIHVMQNSPFAPIAEAWQRGSNTIVLDESKAREHIEQGIAPVLTNRNPPYAVAGGLYDVLRASNGSARGMNNRDSVEALRIFTHFEGRDIGEAGAVCVAGLIDAVRNNEINANDSVLLHITGGGITDQYAQFGKSIEHPATITVDPYTDDSSLDSIIDTIDKRQPIRAISKDHINSIIQNN